MLLGPPEHRRAARATIEPNDNWIASIITLTESSDIVKTFLSSSNGKITGEETERKIFLVEKRVYLVFER